jgi:hypothetical protein
MSKMSRLAQEQQDSFADWIMRYADNYLADEAMRHHDIEQRITALEEANAEPFFGDTYAVNVLRCVRLRYLATALTKYLRENGYPKQPEPTQSDDVDF